MYCFKYHFLCYRVSFFDEITQMWVDCDFTDEQSALIKFSKLVDYGFKCKFLLIQQVNPLYLIDEIQKL